MSTAYVDGCSYNRNGNLKAGAGVVWLNNDPCPPRQLKLGHQSSQYLEVAAILITLQLAASHNIKELLICTDSNYARLSFICLLTAVTGWKNHTTRRAQTNTPEGGFIHIERVQREEWFAEEVRCSLWVISLVR